MIRLENKDDILQWLRLFCISVKVILMRIKITLKRETTFGFLWLYRMGKEGCTVTWIILRESDKMKYNRKSDKAVLLMRKWRASYRFSSQGYRELRHGRVNNKKNQSNPFVAVSFVVWIIRKNMKRAGHTSIFACPSY